MSGFIGWMLTPEFCRHLLTYIPLDTLLTTMMISKDFEETTREYILRRAESGEMVFHDGKDISKIVAFDREKARELVTQVAFLQNLPQIGHYACFMAVNLVVIDIPEGVESIGVGAFAGCTSLTNIYFPKTLKLIGKWAFSRCSSLENIDLFHTNLQELGSYAFGSCSNLTSATIPDSLPVLGLRQSVFYECSKLVPSSVPVGSTYKVVAHLRSQQPSKLVPTNIANVKYRLRRLIFRSVVHVLTAITFIIYNVAVRLLNTGVPRRLLRILRGMDWVGLLVVHLLCFSVLFVIIFIDNYSMDAESIELRYNQIRNQ
ncbi:hypothetical protein TrLO_g13635 [Triparma laevis f. longispina]|uniref:Uncharacterized protein n=1 Tax=Triparma laevis f. longispina TaxID=1714387 RepID=A0A9W7A3U5_9STRA|nr:hypothetical protein TrLO_g13635 [Triparma laevis f. longispina]